MEAGNIVVVQRGKKPRLALEAGQSLRVGGDLLQTRIVRQQVPYLRERSARFVDFIALEVCHAALEWCHGQAVSQKSREVVAGRAYIRWHHRSFLTPLDQIAHRRPEAQLGPVLLGPCQQVAVRAEADAAFGPDRRLEAGQAFTGLGVPELDRVGAQHDRDRAAVR